MEDSRDFANAYKIIQNDIESIRCSKWANVSDPTFLPDITDQPATGFDPKFLLTRTRKDITGVSDQKIFEYEVKWTNAKGRSMTESTQITYTQNGISDA